MLVRRPFRGLCLTKSQSRSWVPLTWVPFGYFPFPRVGGGSLPRLRGEVALLVLAGGYGE